MHCSIKPQITSKLISYLVLFLVTFLLPLWLIVLASSSVDVRKVSLSLKISEIDIWFDKLDADQSGELEIMKMSALLSFAWSVCDQKEVLVSCTPAILYRYV